MCELFAMSCRKPSALTYSLNEFARHGGLTHKNKSGWGIAFYEEEDAFVVREALPAAESGLARYIAQEGRRSGCVIAHVRLATIGEPTLKNTHPFRRALGGRAHIFAHNGTLKGLKDECDAKTLEYEPIGETDSELAFCVLMNEMRKLWKAADDQPPSLEARHATFTRFASDMAKRGSANMLYSDGEVLFAHAHRRIYEENGGFSEPRAPGLSIRNCQVCQHGPAYACDGLSLDMRDQTTTLLASVPLDQEGWDPLPEGAALAIVAGQEVARLKS